MEWKINDFSNPIHVEVKNLLMDDEGDLTLTEDLGEESDIESQDEVEERQGDSGTEQDGEETDEEEQDPGNSYYLGKDKKTKWNKKPPEKNQSRESGHILTRLPEVIGSAKNARTAVECWNNLFTDDILDIIVRCTNQYIDAIKGKFSAEGDIRPTDEIELRAFIGLLYLAGAYRRNCQNLEELWGIEGDGIEKFSLVMNLERFKTLLRCLRFDDRTTRSHRKESDRLAAVRDVFEKFVVNCQNSYLPGENVTIDEMLPRFHGRCAFRQHMPSKPNIYGIKLFALVDARMIYTVNMEIYAGKQPTGPFCVSNKPREVVKRLAEPLFGSGRNITADNWFSDFDLIDDLRTQKLSYVGTVRKNNKQLPPNFVNVKGEKQHRSVFGFNDGKVLVSYIPRKKKNVILVSSLHDDDAIDLGSGVQEKPEMITFYNLTKSSVDTADQMCATYSVGRNTKRWPMVIFFTMLNVGGINSQVIYLGNQLQPLRRRLYLKTLANELVSGELCRRTTGILPSLETRIKRYLSKDDVEKSPPKRRRCTTCTLETGHRRMSNYECCKCHNVSCLSHANMICQSCSSLCQCFSSAERLTSQSP